jgi:2-polyprenyl-6-hydroxyphenyl methylase/3-demethylubiquinone-9 3-methyltransferase
LQQSYFDKFSSDWWDKDGSMKMLHSMNETRMLFIQERILNRYQNLGSISNIFKRKAILDLGCGGGILSEELAYRGASIKAIDKSRKLINTAKNRAKEKRLNIDYECTDIESIYKSGLKFDIIICLEVVEHVDDLQEFLVNSYKSLKKNGLIIFSTINRSRISFLTTILIAENILKIVPKKTHDWKKYVKPEEIMESAKIHKLHTDKLSGLFPVPTFSGFNWLRIKNTKANYILSLKN